MKFSQTHKDWNGQFLETVSIETRDDLNIDDALETFGRFLKAAGYYFDGEVQIVGEEETDLLDDDQDYDFVDDEDQETADENEMIPAFEGPIEGFKDPYEVNHINHTTSNPWPFPSNTKP
jgi:hypothetical protein